MKRIQALNERTIEPCRSSLCTDGDFALNIAVDIASKV